MRGYVIKLTGLIFVFFLVLSPVSLARRVHIPQLSQDKIFDEANSLIRQAEEAVVSGDSIVALACLEDTIGSLSQISDPLEKAGILARAASIYRDMGYSSEAEIHSGQAQELLIQCSNIALTVQNDINRALCFARIARCYSLLGDIAGQNRGMAQVSSVIHNMSYNEIANIDMDSFKELASLMVNSYQEHEGFIFQGSFLQDFLTKMNRIRVYFKNNGGGINLAQCEEMVAFLYDKLGAYNKAVKFYKLAAHRYEGISIDAEDSDLIYISAKLSIRAAELCLEIYNLSEKTGVDERDSAAKSFALASHSYESIGEWKKASDSAQRAFEIDRDRGEYDLASRSILFATTNRRSYADDTGDVEERMIEASLWVICGDFLREYGQKIVEIDVREAMINSYEEAIAAYEEAYSIYRENSNLAGMRETIVSRERVAGYLKSVPLN